MTYTSHGHHIQDSPTSDEEEVPRIARCGGPGLCSSCSVESAKWAENHILQESIDRAEMSGTYGHTPVITANRYVTIPSEIVAIQFTGGPANGLDIVNWINNNGGSSSYMAPHPETDIDGHSHPAIFENLHIQTDAGWTNAWVGYWIIQGTEGEFYPCRPDVFANKYALKE